MSPATARFHKGTPNEARVLQLFDRYGLFAAFYDEQARRFLLPSGPEVAHLYPSFDNLVFNAQGGHFGWWALDHLRGLDGGVLLFAQGANVGFPLPTITAFNGNPPDTPVQSRGFDSLATVKDRPAYISAFSSKTLPWWM